MALHLHRAERTDLLADGLGALLANPLSDPFAEELVLVPARGVERWLKLGDPAIVVDDVEAYHQGHRLAGAPHNDRFRLRIVQRPTLGRNGTQNLPISELRGYIDADVAADIRALLASGASFDGDPLRARDIAGYRSAGRRSWRAA